MVDVTAGGPPLIAAAAAAAPPEQSKKCFFDYFDVFCLINSGRFCGGGASLWYRK